MTCAEPPKMAMASAYIVPKPTERTDGGSVSVTAVRTATAAVCTPILTTPVTMLCLQRCQRLLQTSRPLDLDGKTQALKRIRSQVILRIRTEYRWRRIGSR